MSCQVLNQVAVNANIDNQECAEAEINKKALVELFDKSQGHFSNGCLNLSDVVYKAINEDHQNIADILCELSILRDIDTKKHTALKKYLKGSLSRIALEMNAVDSH